MKKFLTVLLALSVVFTYTVGTAFAADAVPDSGTTTDTDYIAAAVKELTTGLQENAAAIKIANQYAEDFDGTEVKISGECYKATLEEIVADYTKVIDAASKADDVRLEDDGKTPKAYANAEAAKTAILAETVAYEIYNNTYLNLSPADVDTAEKLNKVLFNSATSTATKATQIYAIKTWARALDAMKTEVNADLAKIDMSLYTNDVIQPADAYNTTYAKKAAAKKAELEEAVKDTVVSVEKTYDENVAAVKALYSIVPTNLEIADSYEDINDNVVVTAYAIKDIPTADELAAETAGDNAGIAAKKAAIQASASAALKTALDTYNSAADKTAAKPVYEAAQKNIAAFVEVETLLAEKKNNACVEAYNASENYTGILDEYAKVEAEAATLKLMVEKDGSAVYDAAVIDKNLADVKEAVYAGKTCAAVKADGDLVVGAEAVKNYDLAWEKEQLVAQIEKAMNDGLKADPGYYAPEADKIKAAYDKIIAEVNAAETKEQLEDVESKTDFTFATVKGSNKNIEGVNSYVETLLNTQTMLEKVEKYVNYLNADLKSWEDGYRPMPTKAELAEYLAEAGARTNADVAAKYGDAEAYAKSLPTNGEKNAAVEKAKALIKALPTPVVALTDKAQIEEAYAAAKEAGMETDPTLQKYVTYVQDLEQKAITDAIKALPAKITAADKAAVKAIDDMIKAYDDTKMYTDDIEQDIKDQVADAKGDVKAAEKAAVEAAIAALPADATKAEVEAVRALADAYAAEYRDALTGDKADTFVNEDKLIYAEAQVVAKTIKAVEGLKLTASSTQGKNYIKVKWTVKGDASAVTYYEVRKSTKMRKGFGTKPYFKTTKKTYKNTKELKKGTRYYYKVRAVAEINGVKYTSDWSNKAYRTYKHKTLK